MKELRFNGYRGWIRRLATTAIPVLSLFTVLAGNADAALQAVGPTDPVTTLPKYYQDTSNLALQLCLDQNGMCILTPEFDPAITNPPVPITTTGPISAANFPDESFYFLADSAMPIAGGTANLRLAFEAAFFLNGVLPNEGITFLRVNLKKMSGLPASKTYTVTHPYGTFQFATDAAGNALVGSGAAYRAEDLSGAGYFPPDLQTAKHTGMGPFLRTATGLIVDPLTGHTYVGDPAVAVPVTGSPTGNNFFRIDGPNIGGPGVNRVETNLFNVSGRVYTDQIPTPVTLDRVTYARDAAGGQVDLFVSALTTANLVVSGTGLSPTTMTEDFPNSGKFFAHIPFATLPADVTVTNNLDVPPVVHPVNLVDEVLLTEASYDATNGKLTVKAASRDTVAPLPVLSIPAFPAPNTLDAAGVLVKTLTSIPPESVTVVSSKGGQATLPVSVAAPPPPVVPPVAVNDSASAAAGSTVTINVLANDSSATSTLNPASLQLSVATGGSAVANANGTVSYTAPAIGGGYTFTYTVQDNQTPPATSNSATVTVTVTGGNLPPVAVNDSAATVVGVPVTISVLANDSSSTSTLNPASVVVSVPAGNGAALVNANGTVTYTPPAGPGSYSFSYTVQDNATPPATSNAATVTVTVGALPVAPTAANDAANAAFNTPVTVNVLANDTAGSAPLNAASVLIATAPATGSALVNAAGTITYTPALNFSGTSTFSYTVKNGAGLSSNAATVTVTVAAAALETIGVTRAQYTINGSSWRVDGTVTPAPAAGTTLTIYNNATVGVAPLVTNVPVANNGSWTWSSANGFAAPNAQRRISVQSNQNPVTKRENVTVTVR